MLKTNFSNSFRKVSTSRLFVPIVLVISNSFSHSTSEHFWDKIPLLFILHNRMGWILSKRTIFKKFVSQIKLILGLREQMFAVKNKPGASTWKACTHIPAVCKIYAWNAGRWILNTLSFKFFVCLEHSFIVKNADM